MKNYNVYDYRAKIKGFLKNDTGAVNDYKMAVKYNSLFAEGYYKLANLEFDMKDTSNACQDWHKAEKLCYEPAKEMLRRNCK